MTKDDVINWATKNMYLTVQKDKHLFRSYLLNENMDNVSKENMKRIFNKQFLGSMYFYHFYINIQWFEEVIKNEDTKIILKRFIEFLSKENYVSRLLNIMRSNDQRYYIYDKLQLSKDFIKRSITLDIESYIKPYGAISDSIINALDDMLKYNKEIFDEAEQYCFSHQDKIDYSLLIQTYLKFSREENLKDYQKEFLRRTVYSFLKAEFDIQDLKHTFLKYQNNEKSIQYLDNFEAFKIDKLDLKNYDMVLLLLGFIDSNSDSIQNDGLMAFFALVDISFLAPKISFDFNYNYNFNYINKLQIPIVDFTRSKLYAYRSLTNYNSDYAQSIQAINNIINKDISGFKENIRHLLEKNDILAIILVAVFINNNPEDKDAENYLKQCEDILINEFELLKNTLFDINTTSFDSQSLKNDNIDISNIMNEFLINNRTNILIPSVYLLGHSKVAKNIIKIFLKACKYKFQITYLKVFYILKNLLRKGHENIIDTLYKIGFTLEELVQLYINSERKIDYKQYMIKILKEHEDETQRGIKEFSFDNQEKLLYIKLMYDNDNGFNPNALIKAVETKSKILIDFVETYFKSRENEVREEVEKLLSYRSKVITDFAQRLISFWDNDKIEKELERIKDINEIAKYIENLYTKNHEKNLPFYKELNYDCVRIANSEEKMPLILIKYFISEYMLLKDLYYIKSCKKIQDMSNIYDLQKLLKQIFELWISQKSSVKYKNILLPFSLTANEPQIYILKKQIDNWAENSKPTLAAFAVKALCMNGSKIALMSANDISINQRNKRVRKAALEAMELTASEMGISMEDLNDMIIPDLEFNKNRERIFDYGKRTFKAILNNNLDILLYDDSGKQIKSLPRFSEKKEDISDKVESCKECLKTIKKQLKTIIENQKVRMFNALLAERSWSVPKWQEIFIDNPIMTPFAFGLIWKENTKDGKTIKSFRYMDDGTFNTYDEEECSISNNSYISLLHPTDILSDELQAWKQQLEDYEIIQPIEQINLPILELSDAEKNNKSISILKGKKIYSSAFKSVLSKLGFSMHFSDYGECDGYFYNDFTKPELSLVINIEESFYPGDFNAIIKLDDIEFYRTDIKKREILCNVNPRMLSMGLYAINSLSEKLLE